MGNISKYQVYGWHVGQDCIVCKGKASHQCPTHSDKKHYLCLEYLCDKHKFCKEHSTKFVDVQINRLKKKINKYIYLFKSIKYTDEYKALKKKLVPVCGILFLHQKLQPIAFGEYEGRLFCDHCYKMTNRRFL
jgi:hypothetical protein